MVGRIAPVLVALAACGRRSRVGTDEQAKPDAGAVAADPVEQVAIGARHACAVRRSGEVWCWGENADQQVGTPPSPVRAPGPVTGIPGATQVAAGRRHACALDRDGVVWCWGDLDAEGRGASTAPRRMPLGSPARTISSRCAIVDGGAVGCWDASLGQPALPAPATALAGGAFHECALVPEHGVWCWGQAAGGALARPDLGDFARLPAAMVVGTERAVGLASSPFSGICALLDDGVPLCWGSLGSVASPPIEPTRLAGLAGSRAVATGSAGPDGPWVCAVRTDGTLACVDRHSWSKAVRGEPGGAQPIAEGGADPWLGIAGGATWCAVRRSGVLACWGDNTHGELGSGTSDRVDAALTIADPAIVDRADAGDGSPICAVDGRGAVICWPDDTGGRREVLPPPTSSEEQIVDLSVSRQRACAVRRNGTAVCWTDGSDEWAGTGPRGGPRDPAPLPGVVDAIAVVSRPYGACVIGSAGSLRCWQTYALPDAAGPTPATVAGVADALDVDLREETCVVRRPGRLWCTAPGGRPRDPLDRDDLVAVSLMDGGAGCARIAAGEVWCWSGEDDAAPASRVRGVDDVVDLATGRERACAVTRAGRVACWTADARIPAWEPSVTDAVAVLAADDFACVVRRDRRLACWGNLGARRGDGHRSRVTEPMTVLR